MITFQFLFLFCHVLICIIGIWNIFHTNIFLTVLSPIAWKICFIFNILFLFFLSQLTISILFFKLLLLYTPLVILYFLKPFIVFIERQKLYFQFECFLNTLIAHVKIGSGFRIAFKKTISNLPNKCFQNYFTEILETILFPKQLRKELCFTPLKQIIAELKKTDQAEQCLEHLENLRHQIRIHSIFRKKVHSALLQIYMQSFILWLLYSGLFVFVIYKYGFKYISVLLLSFCLFISGLIILFHCGKKVKWTI